MVVHIHARHVARLQFRCGRAPDIGLEGDIVREISRELQNVAEYDSAAAQDTELHHFVSETVGRGDTQTTKVVFGDLHLRSEAIVPYPSLYIQPSLPTRIHGDDRIKPR